MDVPREYVWYCPRTSCNGILLKTNSPMLNEGKIGCRRCNEVLSTLEIMVANRKNVAKFLSYLTTVRTRYSDVDVTKKTVDY